MKETAPLQTSEHRELLEALEAAIEMLRALPPEQANGAEPQASRLKVAFEKARYAANRLGELWMAARFDTGEFEPENKPVPAKRLIQEAMDPLQGKAEEYDVTLSLKVEGLPVIKGDPKLLKSLMSNLLSSTISVSAEGTQILVSAFERGQEVLIKIEDQGDGISARLFPNLVHSRGAVQGQPKGAVDIGTLMVKPIVDAHNGRLWVERQGESGSALFLALQPVKVEQSITEANQAKVLIVDDDPDGAFMLDQALSKGGYLTEVAYDGLSGLAKARSMNIGLVLLDVMLPGIDGFEVCNRLRSDPTTRDLPIVMISAKSRPEDQETGLRMGANDYLTKPLRLAQVLNKVQEFMNE